MTLLFSVCFVIELHILFSSKLTRIKVGLIFASGILLRSLRCLKRWCSSRQGDWRAGFVRAFPTYDHCGNWELHFAYRSAKKAKNRKKKQYWDIKSKC